MGLPRSPFRRQSPPRQPAADGSASPPTTDAGAAAPAPASSGGDKQSREKKGRSVGFSKAGTPPKLAVPLSSALDAAAEPDSARSGLDGLGDHGDHEHHEHAEDIAHLNQARLDGIDVHELVHLGVTAVALRKAGYKARQLRPAGFTAAQLADAGFSEQAIQLAGFGDLTWCYTMDGQQGTISYAMASTSKAEPARDSMREASTPPDSRRSGSRWSTATATDWRLSNRGSVSVRRSVSGELPENAPAPSGEEGVGDLDGDAVDIPGSGTTHADWMRILSEHKERRGHTADHDGSSVGREEGHAADAPTGLMLGQGGASAAEYRA